MSLFYQKLKRFPDLSKKKFRCFIMLNINISRFLFLNFDMFLYRTRLKQSFYCKKKIILFIITKKLLIINNYYYYSVVYCQKSYSVYYFKKYYSDYLRLPDEVWKTYSSCFVCSYYYHYLILFYLI